MEFLGRLFGFRGRIGRGAFWLLSLPWLLFIAVAFARVISDLAGKPLISKETLAGINQVPLVSWLVLLALAFALLLFISAAVRRLHDLGQPGLLVLVFFLPVLILLSVFALGVDVRWLQQPIVSIGLTALWLWGLVLLFEMAFIRGRRPPAAPRGAVAQQVPSEGV